VAGAESVPPGIPQDQGEPQNVKKHLLAAAAAIAVGTAAPAAKAAFLDFEDGILGSPVGAFYAGQGVSFANTEFTWSGGFAGASGVVGIRALGTYWFGAGNAVVGVFGQAVSSVSITGIDIGIAGIRIDAYDAVSGGNLVAFGQAFGPGVGVGTFHTVTAAAPNIRRFEIYQPAYNGYDGMLMDNLSFTLAAVPGPASLALFGMGLLGLGIATRRRAPARA
jgi:hypothetical protein